MNIIVNGGTKGIGKEIVTILASEKTNKILVTGRDKLALESIKDVASHKNILTQEIDLSRFDTYSEAFKTYVYTHFQSIDILINNAGSLINKEFMCFSDSEAREMMETNFFGPASIIRIISPLMEKGSHIVNISSMGGFQGSQKYNGLSYYSASKAALASLTESLANEFSEKGIIVNCLSLGAVQTKMFEKAFPGFRAPVNAIEMAEFITYFAINGNKYFNGMILPVAKNNPHE
jgi:NAD(P)-dependent dehydrogenase (short-subunit alcohol dehydrogenase family)